ncbi:MAG: hypothetical protein ACLFO2_00295 [Candidatus Woesearchaeota archaeon]
MDDKQSMLAVVGMVAVVAVVGVVTLMQGSAQSVVMVPSDNVAGESYRHLMYAESLASDHQCNGASEEACSRYGNCEWCASKNDCVEAGTC